MGWWALPGHPFQEDALKVTYLGRAGCCKPAKKCKEFCVGSAAAVAGGGMSVSSRR